MLSFDEFLEHCLTYLSVNQIYSWFYMKDKFIKSLTKEELDLIHIEYLDGESLVRIWKKEVWESRPMSQEELERQTLIALEKEDWAEVARLNKLKKKST